MSSHASPIDRRRFGAWLGSAGVAGVLGGTLAEPLPAQAPARVDARTLGVAPGRGDDVRAALQDAIDRVAGRGGGTLYLPAGEYRIGTVPQSGPGGEGAIGITLRPGVSLMGAGAATILKSLPRGSAPGVYFRLLGTLGSQPVAGITVSDLTFDGDRARQDSSIQCSNLLLDCAANVVVRRVTSINANGNGILLRGSTRRVARGLTIRDCTVRGMSYIGIQASQFDGCDILANRISDTGDNAIDVYGEDGSTLANARNFRIEDNRIDNASIGLFVETSRDGVLRGNIVTRCRDAAAVVNRINGEPRGVLFTDNDLSAPTGVRVTGDTGGIRIEGNRITGFTRVGIDLGGTVGRVSRVYASGNRMTPASADAQIVRARGNQISFIRVNGNILAGGPRPRRLSLQSAPTIVDVDIADPLG